MFPVSDDAEALTGRPGENRGPVSRQTTHGRLPALDGIRGVAVAAVVVFHLWPSVAPGGFLGVSVFFTLSGFVITRSLMGEEASHGRVSLVSFWSRRARRLLPASLVTLFAVAVVWTATGWADRDSGRDLLASLGQVANWRFLATGRQYGADHESPVAHFWSLAIEEQFYLVAPILFVAFVARRRLLTVSFVALGAVSIAMSLRWAGDPEVVYFSTFTRIGEIIVGVLLALVVVRSDGDARRVGARWADACGMAGMLVLAWSAIRSSLGADIWYRGGLLVFGLVSCAMILGALRGTVVKVFLSSRPLVALGAISYGVYLVHWPIDVAFRTAGVTQWLRPWISLGVTVLVAAASHRWLERPVSEMRVAARRFAVAVVAMVVGVTTVSGVSALRPRDDRDIDFEAAAQRLAALGTVAENSEEPSTALTVGVFGDSTALMLGFGLVGETTYAAGSANLGCPVGRGGRRRDDEAETPNGSSPARVVPPYCDWSVQWSRTLADSGPIDVAVVLAGRWDIVEREVPALGGWRRIGDPSYDAWLRDEINGAARALLEGGAAHVAWLTLPAREGSDPDPAVSRFNEILAAALSDVPDAVVLDYAGHLAEAGDGSAMRPDGIHLTEETAKVVSSRWLIPALYDVVRPPRPRVAVFGDSTATLLSLGLARDAEDVVYLGTTAEDGCPIGRGGRVRGNPTVTAYGTGPASRIPGRCDWTESWRRAASSHESLEIALVVGGSWDLVDREIPGLGGWSRIGEPAYDDWLRNEILSVSRSLIDGGAADVVWLTLPRPSGSRDDKAANRWNEVLRGAVASLPRVHVADYAGHLGSSGDDAEMRPDGTHLTEETAELLVRRWLAPLLVEIVRS